MKIDIQIAIVTSLITISGMSLAQVPPDIAAGIKNIGPITDVPNTVQLYAPLMLSYMCGVSIVPSAIIGSSVKAAIKSR